MDATSLLHFLRRHRFAVQASVSAAGVPQAAVIGYAVTERLEIIFDTLASSRKALNLRRNPWIALVIGGIDEGNERTVQLEGMADEPSGVELAALQSIYFAAHPNGRSRADFENVTCFRVRPEWVRFSDYDADPPVIVELAADQLAASSR